MRLSKTMHEFHLPILRHRSHRIAVARISLAETLSSGNKYLFRELFSQQNHPTNIIIDPDYWADYPALWRDAAHRPKMARRNGSPAPAEIVA